MALLGICPYLHFSIRHHTSSLLPSLAFPLLRVIGGVLCVFPAQLMIQHRVLTILRQRILFQRINDDIANRHDVKLPAKWKDDMPSDQALLALCDFLKTSLTEQTAFAQVLIAAMDLGDAQIGDAEEKLRSQITDSRAAILLRTSLLIGFFMTLVGYVGCFTLVQDGKSTPSDTYIWLGLEALLSLLRMMIWAWNPIWDDPEGITLGLTKTNTNSLPYIVTGAQKQSLDLVFMDEIQFWRHMTAYCGPIDPDDLQKIDGFEPYYAWLRVEDEEDDRLCLLLEGKYSDLCMLDDGADSAFYDVGKGAITWPFAKEIRLTETHPLMTNQKFKLAVFGHYSFIMCVKSSRPFRMMRTSWTLLNTFLGIENF
ncbi:hypothetical protein B0H14DRAFT_2614841 [Mycena olivaceomarginata]|nr:hypothetical protein B0H14DRAFT_2614841 [Mycena olivaceomarginata]